MAVPHPQTEIFAARLAAYLAARLAAERGCETSPHSLQSPHLGKLVHAYLHISVYAYSVDKCAQYVCVCVTRMTVYVHMMHVHTKHTGYRIGRYRGLAQCPVVCLHVWPRAMLPDFEDSVC